MKFPAARPRGTCPICGADFAVSKAGKVMRHFAGLSSKDGEVCPGSGQQEANLPRGS